MSICFALLLGEVALRVFYPQAVIGFSGPLFTKSEENLTLLKSGVRGTHLSREFEIRIAANTQGYRDREWNLDAERDSCRILFLGDSFLFGWGVEQDEVFVSRLQASGYGQLYNAGMPNDGFPLYARRAAVHVKELRPDFVVLCAYANDYTAFRRELGTPTDPTETPKPAARAADSAATPRTVKHEAGGDQDAERRRGEPVLFRVKKAIQSAHIYRLTYRVLRENPLISRLIGRAYHDQLTRQIFREEFSLYTDRPNLLDRVWPRVHDNLEQILAICRENGASLVVLQIPPGYAVDRPAMERLLKITGIEEDSLDLGTVSRQLRDYCRESGLEFLDPTDRLRQASASGTPMYYKIDLHLNAQGHGVLADFLADWLAERCE